MFTNFVKWYYDWEKELLQVLREPSYAAKTRPGYRRWWANHFAAMSPVERQQIHDLTLRWPLGRQNRLMLILVGLLSVIGAAVHWFQPSIPLVEAIVTAHVLGLGLSSVVFYIWLYYRLFIKHKFKIAASFVLLSCVGAVFGMTLQAI